LVGGKVVDVVVEKARNEVKMVLSTQKFIQYKGDFYPIGWDGII